MKFKFLIFILLLTSCNGNIQSLQNKQPYTAKGFAYIFNENDYENKIIRGRLDNSKLEISHSGLRINSLIKLINPKTNDSLTIKNSRKSNYPDFYKILISKQVARKLNIDPDLPFIEIIEIKKNKSFVAKKAKIFNEEKKISSNAPVTSVSISNISRDKSSKKNKKNNNKLNILIASFYSEETAQFLKKRIIKEIPDIDVQKLKIIKKSNKKSNLISGPYNTINLMKNDYILLKEFGFEELDFIINE